MRNTRYGIRLYAEDGITVINTFSHETANERIAYGGVAWYHSSSGKLLGLRIQPAPLQSRKYAGASKDSSASIRVSDMVWNALGQYHPRDRHYGINNQDAHDPRIVGNYVDEAMTKVEQWPAVGDDLAVRVGPAGVSGLTVVQA